MQLGEATLTIQVASRARQISRVVEQSARCHKEAWWHAQKEQEAGRNGQSVHFLPIVSPRGVVDVGIERRQLHQ